MIDMALPPEVQEVRAKVAAFIDNHVLPAESQVGTRPYHDIVSELQKKARAEGLWCPFVPKAWGGMGLGHFANAAVQVEIGRSASHLGAWAMNCMGPQDATMLTLIEHGTDEQKERYLKPLVDGKIRICFAMTERAAGSDATGMQTTAIRDGDEWVLNGEKWFASGASNAQLALVMARTDPEAPRHRQFTTFLVELPNPGFQIIRDVPTMDEHEGTEFSTDSVGGHAEIRIESLRVPHENIVGGLGEGFSMGQHRLGYGRLRHGMWAIAKAQAALDLAAARVTERSTFGQPLSSRQGVQWMLADCASELYIARLMVMHLAYKLENGLDMRQENSIAKNFIAHMVHKVVDTALQLHGALGYTHDTPLAQWYTQVRHQRLVDGPDEVHRWKIGKNVIAAYHADGTTAAAAGGDLI